MYRQKLFISLIAFLFFFCLFQLWTNKKLEITSEEIFDKYRNFSFFTFILLLGLIAIFSSKDAVGQLFKVLSIIIIGLTMLYFSIVTLFFPFEFTSTKVLYVSKTDPNLQIIQRTFYGGAVTNDFYDTVIIKQLTQNFRWTKVLSKNMIDYDNWIFVVK